MKTDWHPLIQGDLAERAFRAVQEIAAALPAPGSERGRYASLAGGLAGQALFYAYLAFHTEDDAAAGKAVDFLDQAASELADAPLPANLYSGFPGVAWTLEHLGSRLFEEGGDEDDDFAAEIDEALLVPLQRSPWQGDYDLITGLAGLAVYALERLPRPGAITLLEHIVDRLADCAEIGEEGAAWFTQPENLPEWQREYHPRGNYNLGLAHGLPGVIAALAGATAAGVKRARPLLDDSVRWLLARKHDPEVLGSCFTTSYTPWDPPARSRLAWCYGDPGVAAALLAAARMVGDPEWERAAVEVALSAAARPLEGAAIQDAGLCHGAAGLAHLFNRMFHTTGEERLAEAARFWLQQALGYQQPGQGIAGFRSWGTVGGPTELGWRDDSSFLEGAAGIGLALLGAISSVEPAWDRVLMVSLRPVP